MSGKDLVATSNLASPVAGSPGDAVTEDAFLRMERQRPLATAMLKEADKSRIGGGNVAKGYEFWDPQATSTTASTSSPLSSQRPSGSILSDALTPGAPAQSLRASSPSGHISPATLQIFERDVQESTVGGAELSSAIPSHIQTEDHIPSVLEASSEVITNSRLDPHDVEILTHTSHQPAALSVASGSLLGEHQATAHANAGVDAVTAHAGHEVDEASSSYAAVDPLDPRRLSFISFADVVHAEHAEHVDASKEGAAPPTIPSPPLFSKPHTSSPARQVTGSARTAGTVASTDENSPGGVLGGSNVSGHSASQHGELIIETMAKTIENAPKTDVAGTTIGTGSASIGIDTALHGDGE